MTKSPGGWAPWISDPDPPQRIMTDEELKEFSRKAGELLDRKRREEAEAAKQAPAPTSSSEMAKGYIIPVGKRPKR